MATPSVTASQLKEEGNALFVKPDYLGAYEKYTEAIVLDSKNAVLYANRSACSYRMGKYIDAAGDAREATALDPGYAKGWSRLASAHDALMEWPQSVVSWQNALDALPKTNLNAAELKQKAQYEASLSAAKTQCEQAPKKFTAGVVINKSEGKMPWQIATEMLPELEAAGHGRASSSAWVIAMAYKDFEEGVGYMKQLKKIPIRGIPDGHGIIGHTMGLACLSNGLMRDARVFHVEASNWFEMFNDQVAFEAQKYNAWPTQTLDAIMQQAQERQKEMGWDDVRPALSVTVRAWIMRSFFERYVRKAPHIAVELLKRALDLLDWGRHCWKDISTSDRGVIFERTFVRGVRRLYLETLMEAYSTDPGLNSRFPLETLFEEATDLLEESRKNPRLPTDEPTDPGFISSFYVYPVAIAHLTIGFYHAQMGDYLTNPIEKLEHLAKAGKAYIQAATTYPQDDEEHVKFFACGLRHMFRCGIPIGLACGMAAVIRGAIPKMQEIWGRSVQAKEGRDKMLEWTLSVIDDEKKLVDQGRKTMQDLILLE